MLYYLRGTLAMLGESFAVVECAGVGYRLAISGSTFGKLSSRAGEEIRLYCHMSVRDDGAELFGFYDEDELALFKRLITVSGVGPKGAMAILGTLDAPALSSAVAAGDAKRIASAPGVGLKTAQKIIIELKDRLPQTAEAAYAGAPAGGRLSQVVDTLTLYGFSRAQVSEALRQVDPSLPLEQIIGETLKILGKS